MPGLRLYSGERCGRHYLSCYCEKVARRTGILAWLNFGGWVSWLRDFEVGASPSSSAGCANANDNGAANWQTAHTIQVRREKRRKRKKKRKKRNTHYFSARVCALCITVVGNAFVLSLHLAMTKYACNRILFLVLLIVQWGMSHHYAMLLAFASRMQLSYTAYYLSLLVKDYRWLN